MVQHISTEEGFNEVEALSADYHPQHHVGRLSITLNIGEHGNPYDTVTNPERRAEAYAVIIADAFTKAGLPPVKDTILAVQWAMAQHSRGAEPTDIVRFDVLTFDVNTLSPSGYPGNPGSGFNLRDALSHAITRIAQLTEQEAIAAAWFDPGARDIRTGERGEGLFGPDAASWGAFDCELFIRFNDETPFVAAEFPK